MDLQEFTSSLQAVPAWSWVLQGIGLVTAYLGAELNARLRIEGFQLWIASNVVLGVLHAASGLWLLLVLDLLFLRVNVRGIRNWNGSTKQNVGRSC